MEAQSWAEVHLRNGQVVKRMPINQSTMFAALWLVIHEFSPNVKNRESRHATGAEPDTAYRCVGDPHRLGLLTHPQQTASRTLSSNPPQLQWGVAANEPAK